MRRAAPGTTGIVLPLIALLMALVHDPAMAAPPWQDGAKPGNSNSRKWGGNNAPTIQGTPATVARVDEFYAFQATATDKDGDSLRFSIVNKPSWAAFDTAHGYLSGYPTPTDAGTETYNIVISVSDGTSSASLPPFSILVLEADNLPPVISGKPPAEAVVGQAYSFKPTASDPEGQTLLFTVTNRPRWASFNTATGRLYGQPGAADVGVYGNIRITVSDGTSSAALPAFSITVVETTTGSVTLSWTPPTQNVDGTALLDLAGFVIYYGPAQRQYDHSIAINSPGITSTVIGNLGTGTWYFAATAKTLTGMESGLSAEIVRVVQ